jgi:hypothetical protein
MEIKKYAWTLILSLLCQFDKGKSKISYLELMILAEHKGIKQKA